MSWARRVRRDAGVPPATGRRRGLFGYRGLACTRLVADVRVLRPRRHVPGARGSRPPWSFPRFQHRHSPRKRESRCPGNAGVPPRIEVSQIVSAEGQRRDPGSPGQGWKAGPSARCGRDARVPGGGHDPNPADGHSLGGRDARVPRFSGRGRRRVKGRTPRPPGRGRRAAPSRGRRGRCGRTCSVARARSTRGSGRSAARGCA